MWTQRLRPLTSILAPILIPFASSFRVAVFGGSGFIGRRVCQTLVESGCDVVSVSRSGKPPSYFSSGVWVEKVKWLQADLLHGEVFGGGTGDPGSSGDDPLLPVLGKIDAAISLVGNVRPNPEWVSSSFFGLNFDDDRLFRENGVANERACWLAKAAGAGRFIFVSVSYETAKALEGPIPGYLGGKRVAEHAAALAFGEDQTVILGPSLVYGGKRFPSAGDTWRRIVESSPVRAFLATQDFLRNLSSAPVQDWLEKLIFSPPVKVDTVAMVVCTAALGGIEKKMVPPRRQEFYNTDGKPVHYDDVVFIDGTHEIERLASLCGAIEVGKVEPKQDDHIQLFEGGVSDEKTEDSELLEPPFEGALIGLKPYLYPLPVIATFLSIFAAIVTGQFDTMNQQYYDKSMSML